MNERLKELAEQAGLNAKEIRENSSQTLYAFENFDLERFAELVRQDERRVYVRSFMELQHTAIEETRLEEREACAKLCEEQDEYGCGQYARAIRARGEK
jgi:hypothetical protein